MLVVRENPSTSSGQRLRDGLAPKRLMQQPLKQPLDLPLALARSRPQGLDPPHDRRELFLLSELGQINHFPTFCHIAAEFSWRKISLLMCSPILVTRFGKLCSRLAI